MFAGWGSRVARLRWPVLIVTLVAVLGAGVWGMGVFGQLTEGGYADPASESARAADVVAEAAGGQGGDVVAIYTPAPGVAIGDAGLTERIRDRLAALPRSSVTATVSYWDKKNAAYAAKDKSSAVAVVTLAGADDAAKTEAYGEIADRFTVDGATVQLAGGIPLAHTSNQRSTDDLAFAEMISMPVVLILLLFIFGSLVAASLPVIVGGCAVLGSLGVLRAVALGHDVNSFAVNVASLLGLGMAIDYGLFMVGRFREEQAAGHDPAEAVRRTVGTAGRTVLFSATLLMTALAGLLLFPQGFLKSLAYGGLAAVFLAMLLSLTLLPAALAILGPRVDNAPVRLPGRRGPAGTGAGWQRLAGFVLRRPVVVAVPILIGLLVLAVPIKDVRFGENDERMLPAGDPSRVAIATLKASYPQFSSDGVQVVLQGPPAGAEDFAARLAKVPGVASVNPSGAGENVTVLNAALRSTDSFSAPARRVVDDIRGMSPPAGTRILVGGVTARNVDSLDAIADRLPLMIGLLAGATLLLMFLAFGSFLLPVKAVVMSGLSLSATFGLLVWLFQEGHGAGLLGVTPAPLEAGIVVLMAAVVFGLSTDYEVFLLSRMVEARTRGATTADAVSIGLTRTGRVISAAAILLIVVTGAFALSTVTTMRFVGVGMIVALVLDATVVRMLLVPAVLALLGDAAWWAPGALRRLQERAGLAEHAGEQEPSGTPSAADARTEILQYAGAGAHRPEVSFAGSGDATAVLPAVKDDDALVTAPDETSVIVWDPDPKPAAEVSSVSGAAPSADATPDAAERSVDPDPDPDPEPDRTQLLPVVSTGTAAGPDPADDEVSTPPVAAEPASDLDSTQVITVPPQVTDPLAADDPEPPEFTPDESTPLFDETAADRATPADPDTSHDDTATESREPESDGGDSPAPPDQPAAPAPEAAQAEETAQIDEATPTETADVDETAPTDETAQALETAPTDESAQAQETAPTDESAQAQETAQVEDDAETSARPLPEPDAAEGGAPKEATPVTAIPAEVADAFTWMSDPRIAGIVRPADAATTSQEFPWLANPATPAPGTREEPDVIPTRANRPATLGDLPKPARRRTRPAVSADDHPPRPTDDVSAVADMSTTETTDANLTTGEVSAEETSGPRNPAEKDQATENPAAEEAARESSPDREADAAREGSPDREADATPVSGPGAGQRPQTLDEWLHGNPAQARPRSLDDWLSAGTRPADSGAPRPRTLGDLPGGKPPASTRRPATLADHTPDANRPRRSGGGPSTGDSPGTAPGGSRQDHDPGQAG
ncbi:hypothetical protein Asi03nite_13090 [Actinoplanes siamensis]|uniref:Membrane transport protein MMPL domain-containing protein n=1 Tax=Actinoplanes siamensis TaxID=1223317 RepID=A0A919TH84_9ACTN|nr:MMPL family transporter [Actinoplanes siamensis]GIF03771.1 hypothetical protein Asi03nite_13090 [Actinoplanes siamensis]